MGCAASRSLAEHAVAAKSKNAKRSVSSTAGTARQLPRVVRWLGSVWRPFPLVVISVSLTLLLFWPQLKKHSPDLSERDEYRLSWSAVEVTPPTKWIPKDFVVQVRERSDLSQQLSLLDDDLPVRLATAFSAHPWVSSVSRVRKLPRGVRVELTYREPILMVQTRRGLYPVDAEGVLLPPTDFSVDDVHLFPRVEGIRSPPQGPAGQDWGDRAVTGAAKLAHELTKGGQGRSAWQRFELEALFVLPQNGPVASVEDIIFGLRTRNGSRIIWGHAPGADGLEPTVPQKLKRLEEFVADNGGIEYLDEPVKLDITDWEVISWDILSTRGETRVIR